MAPIAAGDAPQTPEQQQEAKPESSNVSLEQANSQENDDEECNESSSEHQPIDPSKHPITPAISKRRQATKIHMIQSPTDNIFSPITKKLLGRKRADIVKELPEF